MKPLDQATQEVRDLFASTHWTKAKMHGTVYDSGHPNFKHVYCLIGGIRHVLLGPVLVESLNARKEADEEEWDWLTTDDVLHGGEAPGALLDREQEAAYAALLREVVFAMREKAGRYHESTGYERGADDQELIRYDSGELESILIDFNDNDGTHLVDVLSVLDRAREILAAA